MRRDEPAQLTPAEVRQLPPLERQPYVSLVRVDFPRWKHLYDRIRDIHEMNAFSYSTEPYCMMLVGPTGAGKSTLIDAYAHDHPSVDTGTTLLHPVLKATIQPPATVKTLATTLLQALGDPRADRGTIGSINLRLHHFFAECQVELLILDELQHFVDRESERVLLNLSNWLKTLIKETHVACVLVGLQDEAERVIESNPQLYGLFGSPHVLAPFSWEIDRPESRREFRTFLRMLESLLPLNESSNLDARDMAWRCFVASDGSLRYLMALIRGATIDALRHGKERLDLELLAVAYDVRLAHLRSGIRNPFEGELPSYARPPIAGAQIETSSTGGRRGSRTWRGRRETAKEIFLR